MCLECGDPWGAFLAYSQSLTLVEDQPPPIMWTTRARLALCTSWAWSAAGGWPEEILGDRPVETPSKDADLAWVKLHAIQQKSNRISGERSALNATPIGEEIQTQMATSKAIMQIDSPWVCHQSSSRTSSCTPTSSYSLVVSSASTISSPSQIYKAATCAPRNSALATGIPQNCAHGDSLTCLANQKKIMGKSWDYPLSQHEKRARLALLFDKELRCVNAENRDLRKRAHRSSF